MAKRRRGMIIKNTNVRAVEIAMGSRTLRLDPGTEEAVTAEEVRDATLREYLQVRAISIVRPTTEAEEQALLERLESDQPADPR